MTKPAPFRINVFKDDDPRLHITLLPAVGSSMLILGITELGDDGHATVLDQDEIGQMAEFLSSESTATFLKLDDLTIAKTNRGEPYREGFEFEITIDAKNFRTTSAFIDMSSAKDLYHLISKPLKT